MTASSTRCEREAWIAMALWTALIFVSVPIAREVRDHVNSVFGRSSLGFLTITLILLGASTAAVFVFRRLRELGLIAAVWTSAVAASLVLWTLRLWAQPEEAFHLVEYGVLSLLATNALRHRTEDRSVFVQAALLTASVGVADEMIQWVNPNRYFGFRDIVINAGAATLVQLALWQGLMRRPRPPIGAASLVRCCRLGIVFLILLGATLGLTPERVERLGTAVPWLSNLNDHEDAMGEYGYLHVVADLGQFKSRFTLAELAALDAAEGATAAEIMSPRSMSYEEFLSTTSRVTHAFPREARIHLSSRNRQRQAARAAMNTADRRAAATVAWRENQILERFFGSTLRHARARLGPRIRVRLEEWADPEIPFRSKVDRHLITRVSEAQALGLVALGILALAVVGNVAARLARRNMDHA